ncbi:MAG TPA: nicotinamide-nucleotide amidohydrolase family protein [Pseudolysinimonas sp.]|nr:nicotinamide-nucleotide amidohydrolase family protein [Pseudolysinimonas sp.]
MSDASEIIAILRARGLTLAVAESLTGGLLVAELVSVPGASSVLRGGVVAYATDLKATLLGVDAALLAASGPIHPDVARAMAEGARRRLGADVGIATTGAAGPDPQDGHAPGEVWLGFAVGADVTAVGLALGGDREAIRSDTVSESLSRLRQLLQE